MKGWFIPHAMRLPPAFCQQYTLRYTIEEKFINLQNWRNKGIFRLSSVLELPGNQSFVCNKISEKFTMAHKNFPPKCIVLWCFLLLYIHQWGYIYTWYHIRFLTFVRGKLKIIIEAEIPLAKLIQNINFIAPYRSLNSAVGGEKISIMLQYLNRAQKKYHNIVLVTQ